MRAIYLHRFLAIVLTFALAMFVTQPSMAGESGYSREDIMRYLRGVYGNEIDLVTPRRKNFIVLFEGAATDEERETVREAAKIVSQYIPYEIEVIIGEELTDPTPPDHHARIWYQRDMTTLAMHPPIKKAFSAAKAVSEGKYKSVLSQIVTQKFPSFSARFVKTQQIDDEAYATLTYFMSIAERDSLRLGYRFPMRRHVMQLFVEIITGGALTNSTSPSVMNFGPNLSDINDLPAIDAVLLETLYSREVWNIIDREAAMQELADGMLERLSTQ